MPSTPLQGAPTPAQNEPAPKRPAEESLVQEAAKKIQVEDPPSSNTQVALERLNSIEEGELTQ